MTDTLRKHVLRVSYDCIFCITQGLAEASIDMIEEGNAVVPSNVRHGVFLIGAKDIITKDSSCTLTKSHYHGTSLSLFQFSAKTIVGIDRNCTKFVKTKTSDNIKIRNLLRFYTDVSHINNQPDTFLSSVPRTYVSQKLSDGNALMHQLWLILIGSRACCVK